MPDDKPKNVVPFPSLTDGRFSVPDKWRNSVPTLEDMTGEPTMTLDYFSDVELRVGHVVILQSDREGGPHGDFSIYVIDKSPGGYVLRYCISETGPVLPVGYTAGHLHDYLADEPDIKALVFSLKPLRSTLQLIGYMTPDSIIVTYATGGTA